MKKIIKLNPYLFYSMSWSTVIFLYLFSPSKLYPTLSLKVFFIISMTIVINIIIGLNCKLNISSLCLIEKKYSKIYIWMVILFTLNFIAEGKIPLVEIMKKSNYSYNEFKGIPTISILILTYNIYLCLCCLYNYILSLKKKYLFFCIISLSYLILLYIRAALMIIFISWVVMYLILKKNIQKYILKIFITTLIVFYMFGCLGNIRHKFSWYDTSGLKKVLIINNSPTILDPFLWSYVYLTVSLANLEYNFKNEVPNYNLEKFIRSNFIPDFINKRLGVQERENMMLINPTMTTGTFYINAYRYLGSGGMIFTYLLYLFLNFFYLRLLNKKNKIIGIVVLSTINILTIFGNIYVVSSISFCLIYPLFENKKILKNN